MVVPTLVATVEMYAAMHLCLFEVVCCQLLYNTIFILSLIRCSGVSRVVYHR